MLDDRYNHAAKVYVEVLARFHIDGRIEPVTIIWEDGRKYDIDRIRQITKAASLKAGGAGIRYTVRIRGTETYLFLEETRWFVERR